MCLSHRMFWVDTRFGVETIKMQAGTSDDRFHISHCYTRITTDRVLALISVSWELTTNTLQIFEQVNIMDTI